MQQHYPDFAIGTLSALAALLYFREEAATAGLHAFAWAAVRFGGL